MYHWKREFGMLFSINTGENVKSENATAVCKGEQKKSRENCRRLIHQVYKQTTFVCVRMRVHVCIVCVRVH